MVAWLRINNLIENINNLRVELTTNLRQSTVNKGLEKLIGNL